MTKLKNVPPVAMPVAKRKAVEESNVSPLPGRPPAQALGRGPGDVVDVVYERILTSLMEHRLAPGTKLVEEKLAGIFNVSRTRIREVLARLSHEGVVVTVPNRGAYVASPTVEEARAVFGARRLVEPALVRELCERARADDTGRLKAHVEREASARMANDRRSIIRLSGEFHILIAELVGNPVMTKLMRELASLTCLIIVLYDSPSVPACPHHEHSDIIGAIVAGDAEAAIHCMLGHLEHIESALSLSDSAGAEADLEAIFS